MSMVCPECEAENLAGAETCANCGQDLTAHEATQRLSIMELRLLETSLAALRPKPPIFIDLDCTVRDAVANLCANHIGCVLVGEDADVHGIFSERDVLLRVAHRADECGDLPVSEFMTPDPRMVPLDTPIAFALNLMSTRDFRHLPVTRDGLVCGIVSLRDVIRFMARWYPDLLAGVKR